jgi:hypothetical protein
MSMPVSEIGTRVSWCVECETVILKCTFPADGIRSFESHAIAGTWTWQASCNPTPDRRATEESGSMLTFEELHGAFVLLCRGTATKRSEIAAAARSWIRLS